MSTKKSVLIVEDEQSLRDALVDQFERKGYKVLQAKDGQEGLRQAFKNQPSIILLDIVLPKMDGITMLEQLRQNAWGKTAKIIILSNLSDWDNTKRAVDLNVRDYLVKSDWKIHDVIKKVKEKIGL